MNSTAPIFREVQPYRELPPFTLLTVAGALFGWFLIVWAGIMIRPLGALSVPPWLAWVIGLPFGILLPFAYTRMKMVTEVYPDHLFIDNGVSGRMVFPFDEIMTIELRNDNINDDYNVRNIGSITMTRTAYTVSSSFGAQLLLADGRLFMIGSKEPQALVDALSSAWGMRFQDRVPQDIKAT